MTVAVLLLWGDESGEFLLDGDESGDLILWGDEASETVDVTTTTETGTRQPGGFGGRPYHGPAIGRIDWDERKRIAAQLQALYREVYEKVGPESQAADEAAALVADFVPTSAPDFPPPSAVDWEAVAAETRATISHMRTTLQALAAHKQRQQDDEEAVIALLLAN